MGANVRAPVTGMLLCGFMVSVLVERIRYLYLGLNACRLQAALARRWWEP